MDKRPRVLASLEGRPVDRVPLTAWRCAYLQAETAQGLARSTLDLYQRCDLDLLVLSPGPYYLAEAWGADVRTFHSDALAPYIGAAAVAHPTGWRRLPPLDLPASSLQRELEAVRLVRAELEAGPPLLVQVPSPLATADALCSGRILSDLRAYPGDVRAGLDTIADGTVQFLRACLEAGADGVFFVVPLATPGALRPRESRAYHLNVDLTLLEALGSSTLRILYLQANEPDLDLAARYPVQAVGWPAGPASSPSLAQAGGSFRGTCVGGLDPRTFSTGSVEDLRAQIAAALSETGGWRLILAPAGALPPDAQPDLLAAMSGIVHEL